MTRYELFAFRLICWRYMASALFYLVLTIILTHIDAVMAGLIIAVLMGVVYFAGR
jgi:hypothetical protein